MHLVVNLLREFGVFNVIAESTNYYRRDSYHELPLELLVDSLARRSSLLDVLSRVVGVHAAHREQPAFAYFAASFKLVHGFHTLGLPREFSVYHVSALTPFLPTIPDHACLMA